jgi:oligoribonuclease NrnB/cAMP/cGMP phosphodiesterase (DHH superfamily)
MRIVTRPDFDGVVCAVLLYEAQKITKPVKWVSANEMQKGRIAIQEGDIIANLPYNDNCSLWFDHHYTNQIDKPFKGAFEIAPSAAGIVFKFYKNKFQRDYSELIRETDKIDSANLSLDEVLHPEKNLYVLLSMTILSYDRGDEPYWNKLVYLLRKCEIKRVYEDPVVKARCQATVKQNKKYARLLTKHTKMRGHVSITDFRSFDQTPTGNRFLIYSLFPESSVNLKIHYDNKNKENVAVHVAHSIFNQNCNVSVGRMLSEFGGGGHHGAGGTLLDIKEADRSIHMILDILLRNEG